MNIRNIQIGITTKCNSKCRFCFREELKRINNLSSIDLPFDSYKNIFKNTNLIDIQFCGNKGDAIFHPEFQKILDYTMNKDVHIKINTNGSIFSKKWWYELGKKINGCIVFAIDGLENTHSIYRKTIFKNVFNNMTSFIEGGGNAEWQFIVFKHNEHQLEEAKELSKKIGCRKFMMVMSREYDKIMEKPINIYIKNPMSNICWKKHGKIYIDSKGQVYPCCYVCCHIQDWVTHNELFHLRGIKTSEHNIANNTLNEIIKSNWFNYIYSSLDMCRLHCEV